MKTLLKCTVVCLAIAAGLIGSTIGNSKPQVFFNHIVQDVLLNKKKALKERPEDRVYVSTDKPMYKPGETIWYTAFVRDGASLEASTQSDLVHVQLLDPKGSIVQEYKLVGNKGIAKGDFILGKAAPGGLYTLRAQTQWMQNDLRPAVFEKEIQVQRVVLPRLKMKLDYEKASYGAGDQVSVDLTLETNENVPLKFKPFEYVVSIQGKKQAARSGITNAVGKQTIEFALPNELKTADALVNVMIQYQGQTESVSRAVPITMHDISLAFFPEGGDLVAGLESQVAFQAKNKHGKPVDISGEVRSADGSVLTTFESAHDGMGVFNLLPKDGKLYTVHITKPSGVETQYDLPEVSESTLVLDIQKIKSNDIFGEVKSQLDQSVSMVVAVRGKEYFRTTLELKKGDNSFSIPLDKMPAGVAQITLFDATAAPVAERLAFINEDKQLNVSIKTNKEKYAPREKVTMTIKTTDKNGTPVSSDLALSVVDDQLLSFADNKSSDILSWLLVEADLRGEIHEPEFYFNLENKNRKAALDLVMMTNGWRRFTWKELQELPPVAVQGERTIISGQVVKATDRESIKAAKVILKHNGKKSESYTDADGRFEFVNVDLSNGPAELTIKKRRHQPQSQQISMYVSHLTYYLYPRPDAVADYRLKKSRSVRPAGAPLPPPPAPPVVMEIPEEDIMDIEFDDEAVEFEAEEIEVVEFAVPLIEQDNTVAGAAVNKQDIQALPADKSVGAIAAVTAGVAQSEVEQVQVLEQGTPASVKADEILNIDAAVGQGMELNEIVVVQMDRPAHGEVMIDGVRLAVNPVQEQKLKNIQRGKDRRNPNAFRVAQHQLLSGQATYYKGRDYAAPKYTGKTPKKRSDFRKTIFWDGHVRTKSNGKATITFYNSDAETSFRATAEGIGEGGLVGRAEETYFTQMPFGLKTKLPVSLIAGDELKLPITLINNTSRTLQGNLSLTLPEGSTLIDGAETEVSIPANGSKVIYKTVAIGQPVEDAQIGVSIEGEGLRDAMMQDVQMFDRGFPREISFSGKKQVGNYAFELVDLVAGSEKLAVTVFPDASAEIMSGLEGMLRTPGGCFEQTSSTTFPNIMVLQYLQQAGQNDPQIVQKAQGLIRDGYKRLISFETSEQGFEWFGQAPAHEGLTAYGLMEFIEMSKIYDGVDQDMIKRTTDWLLSRRDGKGGFKRNARALHYFGLTDDATMSAYITWALTEAKIDGLEKEIEASYKSALASKQPYIMGLAANTLFNVGETAKAEEVLKPLMAARKDNTLEHKPKFHTAPGSKGSALTIEATSLAVMAQVKSAKTDYEATKDMVNWLQEQRSGFGSYSNTNSTILALRAIVAYTMYSKQTQEDGSFTVSINGKQVAQKDYKKGQRGKIILNELEQHLQAGKNTLQIAFPNNKTPLPFATALTYNCRKPKADSESVIKLKTEFEDADISVGETSRLTTTITNTSADPQAMTIAIVSIPGGMSVQPWQLKEHQEKGIYDFYELIGTNVVFYYRKMAENEIKTVHLDLKADIPGQYESQASSAFLYYMAEHRDWSKAQAVTITAKQN